MLRATECARVRVRVCARLCAKVCATHPCKACARGGSNYQLFRCVVGGVVKGMDRCVPMVCMGACKAVCKGGVQGCVQGCVQGWSARVEFHTLLAHTPA